MAYNVLYRGGKLIDTPRVVTIFYGPTGDSWSASPESADLARRLNYSINDFLTSRAMDDLASDFFAGTAYQLKPARLLATYEVTFDPALHSATGFTVDCIVTKRGLPVTEPEIIDLATQVAQDHQIPLDQTLFLVLPDGRFQVEQWYNTGGGKLLSPCELGGFHGFKTYGPYYACVPVPNQAGSSAADAYIAACLHEIVEWITDPELDAYKVQLQYVTDEIVDPCFSGDPSDFVPFHGYKIPRWVSKAREACYATPDDGVLAPDPSLKIHADGPPVARATVTLSAQLLDYFCERSPAVHDYSWYAAGYRLKEPSYRIASGNDELFSFALPDPPTRVWVTLSARDAIGSVFGGVLDLQPVPFLSYVDHQHLVDLQRYLTVNLPTNPADFATWGGASAFQQAAQELLLLGQQLHDQMAAAAAVSVPEGWRVASMLPSGTPVLERSFGGPAPRAVQSQPAHVWASALPMQDTFARPWQNMRLVDPMPWRSVEGARQWQGAATVEPMQWQTFGGAASPPVPQAALFQSQTGRGSALPARSKASRPIKAPSLPPESQLAGHARALAGAETMSLSGIQRLLRAVEATAAFVKSKR